MVYGGIEVRNLAIIPARSGSKGLVDKNIKLLNGKPLLGYSINAALESAMFEEVMVSTDSEAYADIAEKCGAKVPFLRSYEQSGDTAGSWGVVLETLENYRTIGRMFDTICLLQPTSPLRTAEDIVDGYNLFEEKRADAITSVCEMDHSPLWSMTLPEDCSLTEYRIKAMDLPRQLLSKYYRINGALYIRRVNYNTMISLIDKNEFALIMDRERSVDIDNQFDFSFAEWLLMRLS